MTTYKVIRFLDGVPDDLRPDGSHRVTVAVPLEGFADPPFAAIEIRWFADLDVALSQGHIVAEEVVLRGADYLAHRWADGGDRFKMMSFGRRDPALTPAEFSARWRSEAGRLGAEAIPDDVRGLAYVQNHPVVGRESPFDAVNEVWFDDLDHLRQRQAWFAARPSAGAGLMSPTETWSMFLRESLLYTR